MPYCLRLTDNMPPEDGSYAAPFPAAGGNEVETVISATDKSCTINAYFSRYRDIFQQPPSQKNA
jgi:hypothetical protein